MKATGGLDGVLARALSESPDAPAVHAADGQAISFARLDRAIANFTDLLADHGVGPGHRVICLIDNFAVKLTFAFAVWRLGAELLTSEHPGHYATAGLAVEFAVCAPGQEAPLGRRIELSPGTLADEPGGRRRAPPGMSYLATSNTPRDPRVIGMTGDQILADGRGLTGLLGPALGAVYMTTGLDSMRAIRDILRAFEAGQAVVGADIPPAAIWDRLKGLAGAELMLSPLSLHRVLAAMPDTGPTCPIHRVCIGSGTAREDLLRRAHAAFGDVIDLLAGTSETSVYARKAYRPARHRFGQIGPPVMGKRAEIRDEDGRPLPPDVPGQLALWVPPEQRFHGYFNAPPAYDEGGWVYPGFLASLSPLGEITKRGRTDDRLNLGGTRYFAGKIEDRLEGLPQVAAAIALRVYSADGAEALGLLVEPGPGFCADTLRDLVKGSLRGIGEVMVRQTQAIPRTPQETPDRARAAEVWETAA